YGAHLPGRDLVVLRNVIGFQRGTSPQVVAVIAHRDGIGSGADDNDSSTGVMLELAHELAGSTRERGLVFVSTDAGTTGGQGAIHFDETWPQSDQVVAAVVLDSVAAPDGTALRIAVRPDTPRGTSATVYAATRRAVLRYMGRAALTPGTIDQVTGYAIPYTRTEQGPLIARRMPTVTLSAGGNPDPKGTFEDLSPSQLGAVGTTVINLLGQLDTATEIEGTGAPGIFLGSSTARGRLVQLALVVLLAPFIACVLDAAARCRRRRVPIAPGVIAYAWRSSTWLSVLIALWALSLLPGDLVSSVNAPPEPGDTGLTATGILLTTLIGVGWWSLAVRPQIRVRPPVGGSDRTGGLVAAWLGLSFAGLVLCAVNPFALIIVLPLAHACLWLPRFATAGRWAMLALLAIGLIGPLVIIWELWGGQGLGSSAPRAVVAMAASGYLSPAVSIPLALAGAAATQMLAIVLGRYGGARPPKRLYP
ncbi:MAG TPA: M28 family peptidase, partial [Gaiellales bacterium]|nr:M28 family peptidase [Gaiellales bacterium]